MSVCFRNVPRHRGVPDNELADLLADLAIESWSDPWAQLRLEFALDFWQQRSQQRQKWPSGPYSTLQWALWRWVEHVPDPMDPERSSRQCSSLVLQTCSLVTANCLTLHPRQHADDCPKGSARRLHLGHDFRSVGPRRCWFPGGTCHKSCESVCKCYHMVAVGADAKRIAAEEPWIKRLFSTQLHGSFSLSEGGLGGQRAAEGLGVVGANVCRLGFAFAVRDGLVACIPNQTTCAGLRSHFGDRTLFDLPRVNSDLGRNMPFHLIGTAPFQPPPSRRSN